MTDESIAAADPLRKAALALFKHMWGTSMHGVPFYLVDDLRVALITTESRASPEVLRASSGSLSEAEEHTDLLQRLEHFVSFLCGARASSGTASGWVSVADRLPEVGRVVAECIVLYWPYDNRANRQCIDHCTFDGDKFYSVTDPEEEHHWPSHWMPLPPLPQSDFRGLKRDEGPTADAATGTGNTQGTEP